MKLAYYPGCSLESSSDAYDISVRAVCEVLNLELEEVDDWNCCGATEASALGQIGALALVARNLARVAPDQDQLVAPCAACYLNLKKTDKVLATEPAISSKVAAALAAGDLAYEPGRLTIRHLLDVIYEAVGEDTIRAAVTRPLTGLRVAPYYGCQTVRPVHHAENAEYPTRLDDVMRWLGAEVVDYPLKTHCCGGHMTQISEEMSNELIRRLLANADTWKADVIVCLCPMCQLNLDAYQGKVNNAFNTDFSLPILFVTQLIGYALGLKPSALGFGKEIVAAKPVLKAKIQTEASGKKKSGKKGSRKNKKGALPMPRSARSLEGGPR